MAKALDYFALSVLLLISTFLVGSLIFDNIWLALVVAGALSLATIVFLKSVSKGRYKYNPQLLATEFCIQGNEYVAKLLASILKNGKIESGSTYILVENCLIFSLFKFGTISSQDVANMTKIARNHGITKVFALGYGIDRKAFQVANYCKINLKLVKINAIYRYLDKHGALPDLSHKKQKYSLHALFETVFSRANLKYYLFSGVVLIATSFITPLKTYYIVSGSILLLLAFFCLVFGNNNLRSQNAFKELESAADNGCAQNDDSNKTGDLQ